MEQPGPSCLSCAGLASLEFLPAGDAALSRRAKALSEKHAAAVRQFLIENYQVDASRLTAKGLGQTKPIGSNDTPEGRQNNRRVELVKQ